jgi:hypothetical protein
MIQHSTTADSPDLKVPATADPWQHRAAHMRCSSCMWFVVKAGNIGRCRRHAPTLGGYPVVTFEDWCGDHKLDERPAT